VIQCKRIRMDLALSRREIFLIASGALLSAAQQGVSRISVEGYIFQQYASREKKALSDVVADVFRMAREAGFRNTELNQAFFAPKLRDRVLNALHSNGLWMPSVYVGGGMHEAALADATIKRALRIAALCRPFECAAVVNNPDPKPSHSPKSDEELNFQAKSLNRMGRLLREQGFQLRIHNHTPSLEQNAREWRHILHHTDPKYVSFCLDLDWVHQGGLDPLELLREAGSRVTEIHVRNSKNKLWLESFGQGDIDYRKISAYLHQQKLQPLVVVELAYRENTVVTRPLAEDLRLSRIYAEHVFGIRA
jgi:inosose dehydratase